MTILEFCTRGHDELPLSQAIRLYAAETYAMKGVFDVNSTVRLSAIANLSKLECITDGSVGSGPDIP